MWVIFRNRNTSFDNVDKHVIDVVEDDDIMIYQEMLIARYHGRAFDIHPNVYFLQPIFTTEDEVEYFVKKHSMWLPTVTTPRIGTARPVEHSMLRTP
jgi:hypothetical protein